MYKIKRTPGIVSLDDSTKKKTTKKEKCGQWSLGSEVQLCWKPNDTDASKYGSPAEPRRHRSSVTEMETPWQCIS